MKSAEELRMDIPALRQYIDATMPVAPIGNGSKFAASISKFYFAGVFTVRRALSKNAD
jgi:hypothetical protein